MAPHNRGQSMDIVWTFLKANSGILSDIASVLGLLGLFLVYKQLKHSEKTALGSNTIEIVKFLQEEAIRKARYYCLDQLEGKPVEDYSPADMDQANRVCSSFDLAGIFLANNYAARDVVLDSWGPVIIRTHQILEPYIALRRQDMGARFWDEYEWMARQAQAMKPAG